MEGLEKLIMGRKETERGEVGVKMTEMEMYFVY
jgi:hypothetical protein